MLFIYVMRVVLLGFLWPMCHILAHDEMPLFVEKLEKEFAMEAQEAFFMLLGALLFTIGVILALCCAFCCRRSSNPLKKKLE